MKLIPIINLIFNWFTKRIKQIRYEEFEAKGIIRLEETSSPS